MDDLPIKRLAKILGVSILIILVFKYIGLRIGARISEQHQQAATMRQLQNAPGQQATTPAREDTPSSGAPEEAAPLDPMMEPAPAEPMVEPAAPEPASAADPLSQPDDMGNESQTPDTGY